MLTFKHSGRMGDILYSLPWALRAAHGEVFDYVLEYGVPAWDPSGRPHMMELEDAEFIRPLLQAQPYVREVGIVKRAITGAHPDWMVLDGFRGNMRSVIGREIRTWYYPKHVPPFPGEFASPVLSLPDPPLRRTGKLAVCFTSRYRQCFSVNPIRDYRDDLVFVGLPSERAMFERMYFPVEYHPVRDALDLLRFLASCRGFVGNVSGTFAIAECAKLPRILCLAGDRGNVRPHGGIVYEAHSEPEFRLSLKNILEESK